MSNPPKPILPSAVELYDAIMSEIEPDLMTTRVRFLKEKYGTETIEQATARRARYAAAFKKYEEKMKEHMATLQAQVSAYRKNVLKEQESATNQSEEKFLFNLSNVISTF
jgi:molecular chaperone GrpE (heat shock protein)